MSIESPVKLLAPSLFALTLVLSASGNAIAQPLSKVSSTASLSDTVIDLPSTAPKNSLARSGSRNSAKSGSKRNDIGIGFRFGDSTSVGIDAKFAISENISLRPSIYFGNTIGVGNSSSSGGGAIDRASFNAALNENISNLRILGQINSNNSGARSLGIIP